MTTRRMPSDSIWKTPVVSPRPSISNVRGSSSGIAREIELGVLDAPDLVLGVLHDRQVAQAEEVHLEQADPLDPLHVVLRVDVVVAELISGVQSIERILRDHDAGGVGRGVTRQPLDRRGGVEQLAHLRRLVVERLATRESARAPARSTGRPGRDGISFATRSTSGSGTPSARPASRTAARAAIVPKVTICATRSLPYFSVT